MYVPNIPVQTLSHLFIAILVFTTASPPSITRSTRRRHIDRCGKQRTCIVESLIPAYRTQDYFLSDETRLLKTEL
ncbi:hypothetical protein V8F06_000292 [Rhypophila decipiens]